MGTKETDIVGHNATTVTVANDNGKKMGAMMTAAGTAATTPSPTAVGVLKTPSPLDQNSRTSPKGGQPAATAAAGIAVVAVAADELTNGGSSGKSPNSSPGALNVTGSGGGSSGGGSLGESITKNRSPTDSVRNLNINNNQDNGNANDETGKMKLGDKSPSYDGKFGGRNDSVRGRRPTDGDNNVNENGAGGF